MLPLPTLPSPSTEGTSAPSIATTTTPPTVSQGSEESEEHSPTLPPFIDITRTTESSPDEVGQTSIVTEHNGHANLCNVYKQDRLRHD